MWLVSFPSFAVCHFLFFLVTTQTKISTIEALAIDIINQTCKICADDSIVFSYNFCLSSLQAIPASHVTNLQGLAIIGMELALENATNTVSSIKSMLGNGTLDPFALACLEDCLELYTDAVVTLLDGVAAFLVGHYRVADVKMSAVMEASTTCEDGFKEKEGAVSLLTKENFDLYQLCDIGLCIIHLLGLAARRS